MANCDDIDIINHLLEIGFCVQCAIRSTNAVVQDEEELASYYTTVPALEKSAKRNAICILCMGLLEDDFFRKINSEKIVEIKQELAQFDCETFKIGLTYPLCILLREYLMKGYLVDKYPDYYAHVTHPIERLNCKFKNQAAVLASLVNKRFDRESLLNLGIVFEHEDDEREVIKVIHLDEMSYLNRAKRIRRFNNRVITKKLLFETLEKFQYNDLKSVFNIPPLPPNSPLKLSSHVISHQDLYFGARLLKYNKDALMDDDIVHSGVLTIRNIIARVFGVDCTTVTFRISYTSGFPTARILGNGRPVYFILKNPLKTRCDSGFLKIKETELNEACSPLGPLGLGYEFKNLSYCNCVIKQELPEVAKNAIRKSTLLLIVDDNVNVLDQISKINNTSTPLKVSQKRPLALIVHFEKPKKSECWVLSMLAKPVIGESRLFILEVSFTPNLSVYEFVTGDFGRTLPSINSIIGTRVGILAADDYDSETPEWPPSRLVIDKSADLSAKD